MDACLLQQAHNHCQFFTLLTVWDRGGGGGGGGRRAVVEKKEGVVLCVSKSNMFQ